MDQTLHNPEVYDFRQYDRIWQRVAPTLEPYPGTSAQRDAGARMEAAPVSAARPAAPEAPAVPVPAGQMAQLPGAAANPCCMGSAAQEMLEVIDGYAEAALSDRRAVLALARQAPSWARQDLRDIAADLQSQAQKLAAVHYLVTGRCYRPSVSTERIYVGRWCPALRERYHAAACGGLNYARSAEDAMDPCLAKLFGDMSKQSYSHAETLMGLLQRSLRNA